MYLQFFLNKNHQKREKNDDMKGELRFPVNQHFKAQVSTYRYRDVITMI